MALPFDEIRERFICTPSTVAVVGASPKRERPVYGVMGYLQGQGFRLIPVNPAYAGQEILGERCLGGPEDLKEPVDIVALFIDARHQKEALAALMDLAPRPIVWFQPGAENGDGERRLRAEGFEVVSGLCLMQIHRSSCRRG